MRGFLIRIVGNKKKNKVNVEKIKKFLLKEEELEI